MSPLGLTGRWDNFSDRGGYAESLKTQQAEPAAADNKAGAQEDNKTASNAGLPVPALAVGGVVVLAAGAIWLSSRK